MTMANGEKLFTGNRIISIDTGTEYKVTASGIQHSWIRKIDEQGLEVGPLIRVEQYSDRYTRKV